MRRLAPILTVAVLLVVFVLVRPAEGPAAAGIDDGDVLAEGARKTVTKAEIDHLFAHLYDPDPPSAVVNTRRVVFRVHDRNGAPIHGAQAQALVEYAHKASDPTNADGRGSIEVTTLTDELLVEKAGFVATKLPIPADEDGPFDVVLRRATLLTIDVRLPDDSVPAGGVLVTVAAEQPLFAKGSNSVRRARFQSDTSVPTTSPSELRACFVPDENGRVMISEIEPGEITLTLISIRGGVKLDRKTIVLSEGATDSPLLRSKLMPQTLEGIAMQPNGEPARGANLALALDGARDTRDCAEADREGRFRVENLFAKSVEVSFEAWRRDSDLRLVRTLSAADLGAQTGGASHVFVLTETPIDAIEKQLRRHYPRCMLADEDR